MKQPRYLIASKKQIASMNAIIAKALRAEGYDAFNVSGSINSSIQINVPKGKDFIVYDVAIS